jgi:spore coat polysaccharide biosynthesis predicted glycosyltransferase SpsG
MVMSGPEPRMADLVKKSGASLEALPAGLSPAQDLAATQDCARRAGAGAAVLDGYIFNQEYLEGLDRTLPTLWLDDGVVPLKPSCRLVLNQNAFAAEEQYQPPRHTKLLLGLDYVLLRPQFARARQALPRRHPPRTRRLLISFGGADPNAMAAYALTALEACQGDYQVQMVLGSMDGPRQAAQKAADASRHQVECLLGVEDMAELIGGADMALSGSGVTGYEMLCLGLPMVVVTPVDNQLRISQELERRSLIQHLGWWQDVSQSQIASAADDLAQDADTRKRLSGAGMAAVDGLGAGRVASELLQIMAE